MLGEAAVAAALDDPDRADLPEKVRVTLRMLTKVTKDHRGLTAADLAPVLAAGVSRQAVIEALDVAWAFNVITRLADAFEFEVGPPSSFEVGARMLLDRGYK